MSWTARAVGSEPGSLADRVCLAFSGGGMRSFVASVGYLRGLGRARLDACAMVSTVSGGSWFYGVYCFARARHAHEALLAGGNPLPRESLLARACDADVLPVVLSLLEAHGEGVAPELWARLVGKLLLEPYGLDADAALLAADAAHAAAIRADNPSLRATPMLVPAPGAPTWLCNASLLHPPLMQRSLVPLLHITPRHTGIPAMLDDNHQPVGGGVLLETFAFGAGAPTRVAPTPPHGFKLRVPAPARPFRLRDALAASSSAFSAWVVQQAPALLPATRVWTPAHAPGQDALMHFGDGAFTDNTGILGLLMRGARRVLAFVNRGQSAHAVPPDLQALFGVVPPPSDSGGEEDMAMPAAATVQVFQRHALAGVEAALRACAAAGTPPCFAGTLSVIPNPAYGVRGDHDVRVLLVVLSPPPPGFPQFEPRYRTVFHNPGALLKLSPSQANMLADYTAWCMGQLTQAVDHLFSGA